MEHQWLSIGEVLAVHEVIARENQVEPQLRDMAVLESCLFRAQVGAYGTVIAAASALFESLALAKPFGVVNRASAFAVMDVFLRVNGMRMTCWADDALRAVLGQPNETLSWQMVENWLAANTRPI